MPKIKTRRAAAKRFRLTGRGKLRRSSAYFAHILTKKKRSRKRRLRGGGIVVDAANAKAIRKQIPYK